MSVSFDRAASYYDDTRGLPPEAAAEVNALLSGELAGRRRVIEPGIGTGRISIPLYVAGNPMVGVDISEDMLRVLRSKPDGAGMPVVRGDITRMPFADDSFDAAVISHIFHLVDDWETAVSELLRVLRAGSRILIATHANAETGWRLAIRERLRAALPVDRWSDQDERRDGSQAMLTAAACAERELGPVIVRRDHSINDYIDRIASGQWSWTWGLTTEQLRQAAEETRQWAAREFGSLDEQRDTSAPLNWLELDLPG